ncbi:sulfatase-like hydrolase/transferase [Myxococcota bacterium]|nr:sulfatase-like hydrolase/transferase [Myxococcota bacterium]
MPPPTPPASRSALAVPALSALLALVVGGRMLLRPPADGSRLPTGLDVVLVTLGSARTDLVGDPAAPGLAGFFTESVPCDLALATGTWTTPALASALTGQFPRTHGLGPEGTSLPPDSPTLAAVLAARGYATASFLGEYGYPRGSGLERGFGTALSQPSDGETVLRAGEWLASVPRDRRVLLHVHLGGLGVPYGPSSADPEYVGPLRDREIDQGFVEGTAFGRWHPPGPYPGAAGGEPVDLTPRDAAHVTARYRAQVPELDRAFTDLLATLARAGRSRALVAAVGLHGEGLGERGFFGPGYGPYEEILRIPLALRFPPGTVTVPRIGAADLVDLVPTVLDVLNVDPPPGIEGRSLVPLLEGWAQGDLAPHHFAGGPEAASVRTRDWKLVRRSEAVGGEREPKELYNLQEDPGERWNLYRRDSPLGPVGRELEAALGLYLEDGAAGAAAPGETEAASESRGRGASP